MTNFILADDPRYGDRARALIRIGQIAIAKEDNAALDEYFAKDFKFHGPDAEMTYPELKAFFGAMRDAFTDFSCERQEIATDGEFVGCLTTMSGKFDNPLTTTPVGTVQPNGAFVSFQLVNMFRYNADEKLAEEWV